MSFTLTSRDRAALNGVHPDLVGVVERAAELTPVPFRVFEGVRSIERQRENVRRGVSKTMNSRHIPGANGVGHAVDLVLAFDVNGDGAVDGADYWANPAAPSGADAWRRLETAVKTAARELEVPVEWGGDWRTFKDYPHWQLPWESYPVSRPAEPSRKPKMGSAGQALFQPGDRGDAVERYQTALDRLGYTVPLSGVMDDRTVFVVRVVQRQNDLAVDGILGPRTMTAIDAMDAARRRGEAAGAAMATADKEAVAAAPPVAEEMEQAAATKQAVVVGGGGAVAGLTIAGDGVDRALQAARHGQAIFQSGSLLSIAFGLAVVALLGLQAWRVAKRAGALPGWLGGAA
ncbi:peptidoglycan-binding protein [Amorphus sp. 3PC139-8]|uniref:peptidoglycan-binding protein n=1 Tax=Amorphus sp. 3PC139-8 TaxID=2735676 RepID=UPI00345D322A